MSTCTVNAMWGVLMSGWSKIATIKYSIHLRTFYAFQWPFKDILVKEFKTKSLQMDWPSTFFFFCFVLGFFVFWFFSFFFLPSSCKIGVWLNTCKLCCDYQPLKSSLKINLYIVKFPRLFIFPWCFFFFLSLSFLHFKGVSADGTPFYLQCFCS